MSIKNTIQKIAVINEPYTRWKWRQRKVSWGKENPDRTFFVIRRATCKVGLFSLVMTNMGMVKYALDNGYTPVIDMQSNRNTYLEEDQVGKENAWEFYFEQPCGYTLKDIQNSKNIILSNGLITEKNVFPTGDIVENKKNFQLWYSFFQSYLRVKNEILMETEALREGLFGRERVLGVLCRGTDYVNTCPKNHPVQPTAEAIIEKAFEVMDKYNCPQVYLATEDESAYQKFRHAFGEKLKVTNAKRCENTGRQNINEISFDRINDRYIKGREYLINILLLAECNCLVAGSAGGTYAGLLIGKEYEYQYIFDLGTY